MKRADGTALSVIVVMFDHHKSLRNHRDTRTLEHYPKVFYHTHLLCDATRDAQAHSERQRARERTKVPFLRESPRPHLVTGK